MESSPALRKVLGTKRIMTILENPAGEPHNWTQHEGVGGMKRHGKRLNYLPSCHGLPRSQETPRRYLATDEWLQMLLTLYGWMKHGVGASSRRSPKRGGGRKASHNGSSGVPAPEWNSGLSFNDFPFPNGETKAWRRHTVCPRSHRKDRKVPSHPYPAATQYPFQRHLMSCEYFLKYFRRL